MKKLTHILFAACCAMTGFTAGAVSLNVNGSGLLTGATGVLVNNFYYDVSFADGSCNSLFNGCVDNSFLMDKATATLAMQALADQVFTGAFDARPELTVGCTSLTSCVIQTPFDIVNGGGLSGHVNSMYLRNNAAAEADLFCAGCMDYSLPSRDTTSHTSNVWAVFSVSAVPEPSMPVLLGLGLATLTLVFSKRRAMLRKS